MAETYDSVAAMGECAGEIASSHMTLAFREMLTPGENARVTDRYVLLVSGEPHPLANFVIGLAADDMDGLRETLPDLLAKPLPASYLFASGSPSVEVHARLVENGFAHHGGFPGMACDLEGMPATNLPEGYRLVEVETDQQAGDWVSAFAEGYELPLAAAQMFWPRKTATTRFYSILRDAKTVGTSAMLLKNGVAGIYCVATLTAHRNQGLGAHATAEALRQAHAEGYRVGVLQASEKGYGIYKRLGFEDCGKVDLYIRIPA